MAQKSNGAKSLGGPTNVDGLDPRGAKQQPAKKQEQIETLPPPPNNQEPGTQ